MEPERMPQSFTAVVKGYTENGLTGFYDEGVGRDIAVGLFNPWGAGHCQDEEVRRWKQRMAKGKK
jgi:hypothetical protein